MVLISIPLSLGGAQTSSPVVEEALRRLQDRSAKVRAQAALVLGTVSPTPTIRQSLQQTLQDSSPIVRAAAAKALGRNPSPELMEALVVPAKDPDPMVAKWAVWALQRVLASAPRIEITDTTFRVAGTREPRSVKRVFESELLRTLLNEDGPFGLAEAELTLDFSDRPPTEPSRGKGQDDAQRWLREGRFDLAAMAMQGGGDPDREPDPPPCLVHLSGSVEMEERPGEVRVEASIRLSLPAGLPVFEVRTQTRSTPSDPGEDRDEYSLEVTPAQLRLQAAEEAAREVARTLRTRLQQVLREGEGKEAGS